MGCTASKLENEDTVRRCKERRRLMKEAVYARHQLAAAHADYCHSLRVTGSALCAFAAGESLSVSEQTPAVFLHPATTSTPHPPTNLIPPRVPPSPSPSLHSPPPPPPPFSPSPTIASAKLPHILSSSSIKSKSNRHRRSKPPKLPHILSETSPSVSPKSNFEYPTAFQNRSTYSTTPSQASSVWNWENFYPPSPPDSEFFARKANQNHYNQHQHHLDTDDGSSSDEDEGVATETETERLSEYDFFKKKQYPQQQQIYSETEQEEVQCSEWGDHDNYSKTTTSSDEEDNDTEFKSEMETRSNFGSKQQQQPQPQPQPSASSSFNQQQSQQLHFSNKPIFNSPSKKVDPLPDGLPKSSPVSKPKPVESSKALPKLSVKFILHATGNIAAKFLYDPVLVGALRKVPKANWNAKERLWIFPVSSLLSAEKVLSEISGFNVEVEKLDTLAQRAIAAASVAPDLRDWYDRIPDHIESKLMPFQRDGVRFVLQHGGRALLADEMGLGKTLQAIAVAACVRNSWPVLILAPSSLRLHWASTIHQWLDIPSSDILVVLSQSSGSNRAGFNIVSSSRSTIRLDGLFNIISYDAVPKLQNKLMTSEFKVVIADESHFLKNAQAKRTTASLPVIKKAQYAILLSGTPALSRPIELFKQLEALYPDVYKNVHEYGNRYCKGGIFGVYQGASNHEELHNLIKATVMIRRLKKDVLSELPVKRRQQVFLDLPEKDMKQINTLFRELEVVKGKIKACASDEEVESLKFTEKNLINKIYTDSAEAKISGVLDYLGTVIEAGCKFLIFAHHQSMIDSIHEFLLKKKVGCIRIDGKTAAASRQALVTDFQEKDAIKAAVLSIRAGGVGLTLTAASTVIFAELSWTPGDLIQAEDRAHRIGQVSSVNIYYLLANDTVDDIIWDVVQSKLENLGQMLDGQEKTLEVSASQQRSSPAKQRTLDTYMKRCSNLDDSEHQPKLKYPRH